MVVKLKVNRNGAQDATVPALLTEVSAFPQEYAMDITPEFGEKRHTEAFALKRPHPGTF